MDISVFMFLKQAYFLAAKNYPGFLMCSYLTIPALIAARFNRDSRFTIKVIGVALLGIFPLFSRWLKHGDFIGKAVANKFIIPTYLPSIEHFISGLAVPALWMLVFCSALYVATLALLGLNYFGGLVGYHGKKCDLRPQYFGKLPMIGAAGIFSLLYLLFCLKWEIIDQGYRGYPLNGHFYAPHGYVQWEQLVPEILGIVISFFFMLKAALKMPDVARLAEIPRGSAGLKTTC